MWRQSIQFSLMTFFERRGWVCCVLCPLPLPPAQEKLRQTLLLLAMAYLPPLFSSQPLCLCFPKYRRKMFWPPKGHSSNSPHVCPGPKLEQWGNHSSRNGDWPRSAVWVTANAMTTVPCDSLHKLLSRACWSLICPVAYPGCFTERRVETPEAAAGYLLGAGAIALVNNDCDYFQPS